MVLRRRYSIRTAMLGPMDEGGDDFRALPAEGASGVIP